MENKKNYCTNCGSEIKSFETECPYCGTEIKGIKVASSVKEFSEGLKEIMALEMPRDKFFKNEEQEEEYEEEFEEKKDKKIANYIINYPVSNSREDLIEFMVLVTTNIDFKVVDRSETQKAWIKKLDQIYKKANISIKNPKDLNKIKEMYDDVKNKLDMKKRQVAFWIVFGVSMWLMLLLVLLNPTLVLAIYLTLFAIIVPVWGLLEESNKVKPIFNYPKLLFKILSICAGVIALALYIVTIILVVK